MSIFDKLKRQSAASRLIEEQLYEVVVDELQQGVKRNGLWAKALANSQGEETKAKALYISYRVQSLKDESEITEVIIEQEVKEAQQKREREVKEAQQKREQEAKEAQQKIEREATLKSDEAKEILKEKGYEVRKGDLGWVIIEPLGGRQKIATADELYEYALSRKNDRKT